MRRLRSSSLLRNVMAVASGTAAGQVVVFAFSPLITRIYSPETFGLQGVFLSLISILSPVIALRYPMAIVVARDDTDAARLSYLSLGIAFGLSIACGLLLLMAHGPVLSLLGAEALGALIWFLPLALFCVALQDIMDFRAARLGSFRLVGIVTVVQSFATNLTRVLGGLVNPVAGVLVAVTALAPALHAAQLAFGTRYQRPDPSPRPTRAETWRLLRRHADFPLYRMPTDVLNAASQAVPVILLAALFSPATAGLYTLTRSVLNLPSNVIGAAVGNVLYARFAELDRAARPLLPLLLRSTLALLALAPVIVGLAWFAPPVFALLFGETWREAGYYAQWMSLWIAMMIINIPTVRIAPVIASQRLMLLFNIALLAVRVAAVLITARLGGDARAAVLWFSVASVLMIGLSILLFAWRTAAFDHLNAE